MKSGKGPDGFVFLMCVWYANLVVLVAWEDRRRPGRVAATPLQHLASSRLMFVFRKEKTHRGMNTCDVVL
jgi:hypothetical protein